ncbi:MAG: hypothetical protein LRZ85_02350 [Alphaproteobacteria bacterium]|nr:hypothetical protein [Alphaproteobacteria bacterium]
MFGKKGTQVKDAKKPSPPAPVSEKKKKPEAEAAALPAEEKAGSVAAMPPQDIPEPEARP